MLLFLILCVNSSIVVKAFQLPLKSKNFGFQDLQNRVFLTKKTESRQYSPHEPIHIFSDNEFNIQGFPGSGTVSDPYRIEGYNITAPQGELILIRHTQVYFMIKNNLLNGLSIASSGIKLINVDNGIIENNYIVNHTSNGIDLHFSSCNIIYDNVIISNFNGIRLKEGHINNISENIISNNKQSGIASDISDLNIFSHNVITENQLAGIRSGGVKNLISANLISNNSFQGILASYNMFDAITNNIIANNGNEGILISGNHITITNNTISNNDNEGLLISESSYSSVLNNTFSNNKGYGVLLDDFTQNAIVSGNSFIRNNPMGGSQAADTGINNIFDDNSWDDWTITSIYPIDLSVNYPKKIYRSEFTLPPNVIIGVYFLLAILSVLFLIKRKQRTSSS